MIVGFFMFKNNKQEINFKKFFKGIMPIASKNIIDNKKNNIKKQNFKSRIL